MTARIIQLPRRQDVRKSPRRLARKPKAQVIALVQPPPKPDPQRAYALYLEASAIDESRATYAEAERLYRRAVELDPKLALAWTNLGNVRYRLGDEQDAIDCYNRAIKLDPMQPEAWYNLGYLTLENDDADKAIGMLQTATACDERFAEAWFNLAMAFERTGEVHNAQPCWRKYLSLEPKGTWADIARRHVNEPVLKLVK